ncbi:hypothetical protein OSB04_030717 [Centaurea solstitialis]|uniref:Protein kinase domain-containing protein n=1 Tax=Centaurea solstitialis TaxID=347529 RepID=A0AA38S9B4_9ASTR|nr:hypothetical protein OSB04_030717 [Centaurea solstitialis]
MTFMDEFQHLKIQLEEIKSATNNFADNNQIGRGGFGKVYKGIISHSKGRSMAAIKRLDCRYGQGNTEFWREIMMLSRYTHENLISLLGFCDEDGEKILVYEHASHGSLNCHLSSHTLTWAQRLKICLATTRGLSYLHDPKGTQQRVLHRDIKSSNILLDENWNAKISDFGLSKIGPANQQHTVLVSNVVGTLGYLDPLYMEMGWLTKESDVYSLGVVLFEVLCGRLCFEYNDGRVEVLTRIWKQSYKQKKIHEVIHQDLLQQMDSVSLERFSDVAYQCLRTSREKRPTMTLVMEKLEIALKCQEVYEEAKQPMNCKEMIQTAVPPLLNRSKAELDMLHYEGILVNGCTTQHTKENVTLDLDSSPASNLENQEYMSSTKGTYEEEKVVDVVIIKDGHVNLTKFDTLLGEKEEEDHVEVEAKPDDSINKLKLQQKFTDKLPASHVPNITDPFLDIVNHRPTGLPLCVALISLMLFVNKEQKTFITFRSILECLSIGEAIECPKKRNRKPNVDFEVVFDIIDRASLDESMWTWLANKETGFGDLSQLQKCRYLSMQPQQKSSRWRKGSVKALLFFEQTFN